MNRTMFAYSFQGLSHIRKEEDPDNLGKSFPCQDRSFSGDFEASEIPEKKDIQLFVKNQKSILPSVSVSVELKPHANPFSLICVSVLTQLLSFSLKLYHSKHTHVKNHSGNLFSQNPYY